MLPGAFLRKSQLPGEYLNEFLALPDGHPVPPDDFLAVREKKVRQQLKRLKVEKATGPNEVSARVLKKCADSPARPLTFIIRLVLQTSRRPSCERFHHTAPLYKKKARSDPNSYRRVHLTGQISKVAERVIGKLSPRSFSSQESSGIVNSHTPSAEVIVTLWRSPCCHGC